MIIHIIKIILGGIDDILNYTLDVLNFPFVQKIPLGSFEKRITKILSTKKQLKELIELLDEDLILVLNSAICHYPFKFLL